ncbi:MAG TPA: hypothetical protein DD407_14810, partial [Pseudohongiella sp.]|nr:hypothetical protein [Pseudohongiella sp.]
MHQVTFAFFSKVGLRLSRLVGLAVCSVGSVLRKALLFKKFVLLSMLWMSSAVAVSAEISDQLRLLNPMVYFSADNLASAEDGSLNEVGYESLRYLGGEPVTVPSFLGEHAGKALRLNGQDSLSLFTGFLEGLSSDVVLGGYFNYRWDEAAPEWQCLFSVGNRFALLFGDGGLRAYVDENGVSRSEHIAAELDKPSDGLFIVFAPFEVEVYLGLKKIWALEVPDGVSSLSGLDITLGNCSSSAKAELVKENVSGFQGDIDELIVVRNDAWHEFMPLQPSRMVLPKTEQLHASRSSVLARKSVVENEPPVSCSNPELEGGSVDSTMTRAVLMMAAFGYYPLQSQRWSDGLYSVWQDESSFVAFLYPEITRRESLNAEASYYVKGEDDSKSHYLNYEIAENVLGILNGTPGYSYGRDGLSYLAPMEQAVERIRYDCSGDDVGCQNLYRALDQGVAFGKPSISSFNLVSDSLPSVYERSLKELSFSFSAPLTDQNSPAKVLDSGLVKLYLASDADSNAEVEIPVKALGQGRDLRLEFESRIRDGRYRVVFDASLSSNAGVALGEERVYEFSIEIGDVLVDINRFVGAYDSSLDGKRLIVDGAELTISGHHDFESVVVRNQGVITAQVGQALKIAAESISVDSVSRIDVSGRGLLGTTAIGSYTG